jgi:hypothetical protein
MGGPILFGSPTSHVSCPDQHQPSSSHLPGFNRLQRSHDKCIVVDNLHLDPIAGLDSKPKTQFLWYRDLALLETIAAKPYRMFSVFRLMQPPSCNRLERHTHASERYRQSQIHTGCDTHQLPLPGAGSARSGVDSGQPTNDPFGMYARGFTCQNCGRISTPPPETLQPDRLLHPDGQAGGCRMLADQGFSD